MIFKSNIFKLYKNQFVSLITKVQTTRSEESMTGVITVTMPMPVDGFLLKEDKTHYHLGDSPYQITHSVDKTIVATVELIEQDYRQPHSEPVIENTDFNLENRTKRKLNN